MRNIITSMSHKTKIYIVLAVIFTHISSMLFYPAIKYKFDWHWIHQTWMDWQTYNSAMIALIASLIAFEATVYSHRQEKINNFRAAKATLAHALNDICNFTSDCEKILCSVITGAKEGDSSGTYFKISGISIPTPTSAAMNTFVDCIRYSDTALGNHLAKIMEELQVAQARIENLRTKDLQAISVRRVAKEYIDQLAEIRVYAEDLFFFARNIEEFTEKEITKSRIHETVDKYFNKSASLLKN
ncbi:hypothetical protein [Delftia lacustris]